MVETRAIVIKQVAGNLALVEAVREGGCSLCAGSKGCGGGTLSQLFCVRPRRFRVNNAANAHVGEEVTVSVTDGVLLQSALILYGLPLLFLFGGALLGAQWPDNVVDQDIGAATGAVCGLICGFLLAAYVASRRRLAGLAEAVITAGK
jgi:sigma-E factor negative regulatory protein RseC